MFEYVCVGCKLHQNYDHINSFLVLVLLFLTSVVVLVMYLCLLLAFKREELLSTCCLLGHNLNYLADHA